MTPFDNDTLEYSAEELERLIGEERPSLIFKTPLDSFLDIDYVYVGDDDDGEY